MSLRYRLPPGSAPPLTDVIGHLVSVAPEVEVRTKSGDVVVVARAAVVSVRELSHTPVRASEIRAVEYAAALAWPGLEQRWLGGWFLRAGGGVTSRANSAVPLEFSAALADLDAIADWYAERDLPPWLALPERLLPVRVDGVKQTRVMVCDVPAAVEATGVTLLDRPDHEWLAGYARAVPAGVLTAVVDGEVTFAAVPGAAVGRGAVTPAPDGTRWLGLSSVRVAESARRGGHARAVCAALFAWGAGHGAQRAYVQVLADNAPAIALYQSMGFVLHHHHRYVDAATLLRPRL